jgi:hypothetical protein
MPLACAICTPKYAEVVSTPEILSYFNQLPADLFDLPAGKGAPRRKEAAG